MILFRCRQPGDPEWTVVQIQGEDEEAIASIVGSSLETCPFITQMMPADSAEWEPI